MDEATYDDPIEVPGLGDAAFWKGQPQSATLIIFKGGTMLLSLGPGTLEQLKTLALKALGGNGKTGYVYGTPRTPIAKPVLHKLGLEPNHVDQLKHALTVKAEARHANAELALGSLYEYGERAFRMARKEPEGN